MKESKNAILSRLALPIWMLALLGQDLLFRRLYGFAGGVDWLAPIPLSFTLLWLLVFGGLVLLLPRLGGRVVVLLITVLSCLLTVVHAVMYHLFGNFFGFSDLLYAGDGAAFFSVQYLQMRKLLLADIVLTLAVGILAVIFLPRHRKEAKAIRRRVAGGLAAICIGLGGLFVLNQKLSVEMKANEIMTWKVHSDAFQEFGTQDQIEYTRFQNSNVCLPLTGLYQYTARDLAKNILSDTAADKKKIVENLEAWCRQRQPHEDNEMTGCLKGKNLIMIMVESLDTWMLREDVMPNLCALQKQSLNMVHHYTPLYLSAGTFSTEFCSQTGIIPPPSGVSTNAYYENDLPASLPHLFAREGYRVNSFHPSYPSIYNRGAIHKNLGFEAYHDFTMMHMKDYMLDTQMLNGFDQMVSREQPFYSFIITYSGHGPYNEEMNNIAQPHLEQARKIAAASGITASADVMEQYTRALAHIMETDDFIGGLMERLEQTGLADNTVIVLYGDHFCKYLTDLDFLQDLKGVENRNLLCNTPWLIWSRDLAPATEEKYSSTADIFPTICNLFDLDADLQCFVGDDLFSEAGGLVYWRDGSVYDGSIYVDGTKSENLTQEEYVRIQEARDKLDFSWNSFRYNFFSIHSPLRGK